MLFQNALVFLKKKSLKSLWIEIEFSSWKVKILLDLANSISSQS